MLDGSAASQHTHQVCTAQLQPTQERRAEHTAGKWVFICAHRHRHISTRRKSALCISSTLSTNMHVYYKAQALSTSQLARSATHPRAPGRGEGTRYGPLAWVRGGRASGVCAMGWPGARCSCRDAAHKRARAEERQCCVVGPISGIAGYRINPVRLGHAQLRQYCFYASFETRNQIRTPQMQLNGVVLCPKLSSLVLG
jgi:hypothetical protein